MRTALAAVGILALPGCGTVSAATTASTTTAASRTASASGTIDLVATTEADLADIRAGNCGLVAAQFDATVAASLSAVNLCAAWAQYTTQFGAYKNSGAPTTTELSLGTVMRVPLTMTLGPGEFRLTFTDGKISGIYFLRQGVPL